MLVLPQAEAKLKNKCSINGKCQIEKRLLEQMFVSDTMFIVSGS
jgi:hypothetical protein